MEALTLIAGTFAVLFLTYDLTQLDGPGKAFVRLRSNSPSLLREGLSCFWCTSLWVALLVGLLSFDGNWSHYVLSVLAMAGGACFLYSRIER